MRTLTLNLVALVSVLGFATATQASTTIDFTIGGSASVAAAVSSTVTVDITLSTTGSVTGYQFSITWDPTELTFVAGTLANTGPSHSGSASWTNGGAGEILLNQVTGDLPASISSSTLVAADDIVAADGVVSIGSLKFHVASAVNDGNVDVSAFINSAFGDGLTGSASGIAVSFNGAGINVVPEPTTASLLGLGLLGLTVAGRRRKN